MTENQQDNPDKAQSTDRETFAPRDLVTKGGYDKDPKEILSNPAVAPEMLGDRRDEEGVGMGQDDDQDSD